MPAYGVSYKPAIGMLKICINKASRFPLFDEIATVHNVNVHVCDFHCIHNNFNWKSNLIAGIHQRSTKNDQLMTSKGVHLPVPRTRIHMVSSMHPCYSSAWIMLCLTSSTCFLELWMC